MLINILLNFLLILVGAIFSFLDPVTALPTIHGYDLDSMLATGIGQLNQIMLVFWPLQIMFWGFLFLMLYYILKMTLRLIIGHRSPN